MNSSELIKQAESEENDLKSMGLYTKILREERAERFENYKDKLLQAGYNLTEFESQGKFTIEPTKFGIIDYYPKSNKVLIRKENKWITGGLRWIIGGLLNGC
jgi:TPP-dependent 2-oxoacid decarboxylase